MSLSDTAPGIVELHGTPDPTSYRRLLDDVGRTRRCPVLFGFRAVESAGGMPVPDDPWAAVDATDAHAVLEDWWPGPYTQDCLCLDPWVDAFPPRPDGGPDRSRDATTLRAAAACAHDLGPYSDLAVIDAARPADVPLAVRWSGPCNYPRIDLVGLTAVLRSWEDRFGAMLVRLDGATLTLTVAHPPRTTAEAEALAAEHFAFCSDQQDPQNGTVLTPRSYAATIRGADTWRFWWD
ncbi:hypothetical protein GCM10023201_21380 [Actinomycetospora corticicola]|uniref:DUF4253 domain-containing protein n=1 Tax=Actinomycetospora corticicola TaxID=663602 RepID=A0A7Y9J3S6_9PSEU|nr:hypothetical protein [Actinomycetospora corticicola]